MPVAAGLMVTEGVELVEGEARDESASMSGELRAAESVSAPDDFSAVAGEGGVAVSVVRALT